MQVYYLNPLPNDKILYLYKVKALADNKINVTQLLKLNFRREKYIIGKGENASYQHFVLFSLCFQKAFPSGT